MRRRKQWNAGHFVLLTLTCVLSVPVLWAQQGANPNPYSPSDQGSGMVGQAASKESAGTNASSAEPGAIGRGEQSTARGPGPGASSSWGAGEVWTTSSVWGMKSGWGAGHDSFLYARQGKGIWIDGSSAGSVSSPSTSTSTSAADMLAGRTAPSSLSGAENRLKSTSTTEKLSTGTLEGFRSTAGISRMSGLHMAAGSRATAGPLSARSSLGHGPSFRSTGIGKSKVSSHGRQSPFRRANTRGLANSRGRTGNVFNNKASSTTGLGRRENSLSNRRGLDSSIPRLPSESDLPGLQQKLP